MSKYYRAPEPPPNVSRTTGVEYDYDEPFPWIVVGIQVALILLIVIAFVW
jgi:hypothetical protein